MPVVERAGPPHIVVMIRETTDPLELFAAWYGEAAFDPVQQVHDAWPDKKLLFTEGCQEGGPHHGSWELGERYARSMINDLNRWTVGWIDWTLWFTRAWWPGPR